MGGHYLGKNNGYGFAILPTLNLCHVSSSSWAEKKKRRKTWKKGNIHKYVCLVMIVRLKEGGTNSG